MNSFNNENHFIYLIAEIRMEKEKKRKTSEFDRTNPDLALKIRLGLNQRFIVNFHQHCFFFCQLVTTMSSFFAYFLRYEFSTIVVTGAELLPLLFRIY